jgi:hypothetical protein
MARHERCLVSRRQFIVGSGAVAGALVVRSESASAATPSAGSMATQTVRQSGVAPRGNLGTLPFRETFHDGLPGSLVRGWDKMGGVRLVGATPFGSSRSLRAFDNPNALRHEGLMLAFDDLDNKNVIPGRVVSAESFTFRYGRDYQLTYVVAGAHRVKHSGAAASTLMAGVPGVSHTVRTSLRNSDPFRTVRFTFSPSKTRRSRIEFATEGPASRSGVLLSSVYLEQL